MPHFLHCFAFFYFTIVKRIFAIEAGDLLDSVKFMQKYWFYYTPTLYRTQEKHYRFIRYSSIRHSELNNIKANNGKIAISVYDAQNLEEYQIKGTAKYVTEGTIVDTFKAMVEKMFNGAATAKGALIITPSKVIVTTPGAENKKEI